MRKSLVSLAGALLAGLALAGEPSTAHAGVATTASGGNGIVSVRSVYPFAETITRLKADIDGKKIMFFMAVDQAQLAADAGIKLNPSTLLVFGNPPLGTQFITAKPEAGLDWPVRLLVSERAGGEVIVSYTDFDWIARRHGIITRDAQFKMASEVIGSITSSVTQRAPSANAK